MDGLKFLIKAGDFKKWSGPQRRLGTQANSGFNRFIGDTGSLLVVLVLTKNQDGQSYASLLR
jgi:hypothetical protein